MWFKPTNEKEDNGVVVIGGSQVIPSRIGNGLRSKFQLRHSEIAQVGDGQKTGNLYTQSVDAFDTSPVAKSVLLQVEPFDENVVAAGPAEVFVFV